MILNNFSKKLFIWILLLIPLWEVISAQLNFFFGLPSDILGGGKYLFFLLLIICLFLIVIFSKRYFINKSVGLAFLTVYMFYIFLHFIGTTEMELVVNGLRYEVLYVVLVWLLLLASLLKKNEFLLWKDLERVFFTLGFIVIFFAALQYFDNDILAKLYRKNVDDIANITLAVGNRLTSVLVNPINFASFLVILFIFVQVRFEQKRMQFIPYASIVTIIFFMILGSLSRASFIAFILVSFLFISYRTSLAKKMLFGLLSLLIATVFISATELNDVVSRYESLLFASSYTGNDRVGNWELAINSMLNFEVLWGRGLGASSPDQQVVRNTSAMTVENSFVTVYLQYGVIGVALFLLIFLRFTYVGFRLLKVDESASKFCLSFVLFFTVMSFGNDFTRNFPFGFYFWLFFAYFEYQWVSRSMGRSE